MWAIDRPKRTAEEVARTCADGMQDEALQSAVLAAIDEFLANSAAYQSNAASDLLHQAVPSHYPVTGISDDEMRWIYSRRLAGARSPGRAIYDEIMRAAPHKLCAYCQCRPATTLDHFVPKATLATLSVEPWNLIPCCFDCNHRLGTSWSPDPASQMLHPYFMPELGRWLRAEVEHTSPVTITYFAEPEVGLDSGLVNRVCLQFNKLSLGSVYSIVSSPELTTLGRVLNSQFSEASDIKAYLLEIATETLAVNENDRRGAMYEALGRDDWYCINALAV